MRQRRSYPLRLTVNGALITEVIIDSHYVEKHPEMNDLLILRIVSSLDGRYYKPVKHREVWEYFRDELDFGGRKYRLIWCFESGKTYFGVINCFRR